MLKLLLLSLALGATSLGPGTSPIAPQDEKAAREASDTRHGLKLSIELDRQSYILRDHPKLKIVLRNESKSPMAICKRMGFGATSTLYLVIMDLESRTQKQNAIYDQRDLPPFPREDLKIIYPGGSFTTYRWVSFYSEGVTAPGTYELTLWYTSPVAKEDAPAGLNVWVKGHGSLQAKPVTFKVTP